MHDGGEKNGKNDTHTHTHCTYSMHIDLLRSPPTPISFYNIMMLISRVLEVGPTTSSVENFEAIF